MQTYIHIELNSGLDTNIRPHIIKQRTSYKHTFT